MTTKPVAIVCRHYKYVDEWLHENAESYNKTNLRGEMYNGRPFVIVVALDQHSIERYRGQEFSELQFVGPEPPDRHVEILKTMVR